MPHSHRSRRPDGALLSKPEHDDSSHRWSVRQTFLQATASRWNRRGSPSRRFELDDEERTKSVVRFLAMLCVVARTGGAMAAETMRVSLDEPSAALLPVAVTPVKGRLCFSEGRECSTTRGMRFDVPAAQRVRRYVWTSEDHRTVFAVDLPGGRRNDRSRVEGDSTAHDERADESARRRSGGVGRLARQVEARPRAGRASADDGADGRVGDGADDQRGRLETAAARAGVAPRPPGARQRAAAARGVSPFGGVILGGRRADVSDEVALDVGRTRSVLAVGTNEVAKAGGGFYWPGSEADARDLRVVESDEPNAEMKLAILKDLLQRLQPTGVLVEKAEITDEMVSATAKQLKGSRFMAITEFGRAVHAEMGVITDAARRGVPLRGATMYGTTFRVTTARNTSSHRESNGSCTSNLIRKARSPGSSAIRSLSRVLRPEECSSSHSWGSRLFGFGSSFSRRIERTRMVVSSPGMRSSGPPWPRIESDPRSYIRHERVAV